jgi:uncharacterized membrane protein YkoI
MVMKSVVGMALVLGAPIWVAEAAPHPRDQDMAYSQARAGNIRPLPEIERGVLPRMRGSSYLGPEFDPGSATYRLKFMRGGSVIWVDVDARTGAIIGRSGD